MNKHNNKHLTHTLSTLVEITSSGGDPHERRTKIIMEGAARILHKKESTIDHGIGNTLDDHSGAGDIVTIDILNATRV